MSKLKTIFLATLGGVDVTVTMITPILLVLFWQNLFGLNSFGSYLIFILCLLATLFRAIKIGFMKG